MPDTDRKVELPIFYCDPEEDGCGAYLTSFNYSCETSGREWGSASFTSMGYIDHNYDDTESLENDSYEYRCPDCDKEYDGGDIEEHTKIVKYPSWCSNQSILKDLYNGVKTKTRRKTKPISGSQVFVKKIIESSDCHIYSHGLECPECGTLSAKKEEESAACVECGYEAETTQTA